MTETIRPHDATANRGEVGFEVRDGDTVVDIAYRFPRHHFRWQSVTYKGHRFQLFGGIRPPLRDDREPLWINLGRPIGGAA